MTAPKRPARYSDELLQVTAKSLLPSFLEWVGEDTDAEDNIKSALSYASPYLDGYVLAKHLEDEGYTPDAELVEILDKASYYHHSVYRKACEQWVEENKIVPRFGVGDEVSLNGAKGVIKHLSKEGTYTVFSQELGHVPDGTGDGTTGFIINWETLEGNP